jgi:hypothetical protein
LKYLPVFLFFLASVDSLASADTLRLQVGSPYVTEKNRIAVDLFYQSDSAFTGRYILFCFRVNEKDSLLVYQKRSKTVFFKKSAQMMKVDLTSDDSTSVHNDLAEILRRTDAMPAGTYQVYLAVLSGNRTVIKSFIHYADSSLSAQSSARKDINDVYAPEKKLSVLGVKVGTGEAGNSARNAKDLVARSSKKLNKAFKAKGLSAVQRGEFIDVYYRDWFVGYYKVDASKSIVGSIDNERKRLSENASSLAKNDLSNIQSIFSQVRELNKKNDRDREVSGEIGVTGNLSNGQEENSEQDNNYYELNGRIEVPVMKIPVSIEGYYTSQDKYRTAKASYLKVHYDTEKSKEELRKLIDGYKKSYENTMAKGKGLEGLYQSYMGKLSSQKGKLLDEIRAETGIPQFDPSLDTSGLMGQLTDSVQRKLSDSDKVKNPGPDNNARNAKKASDSAARLYNGVMEKYNRIQDIQNNLAKYQKLLDQYNNTTYFDSALSYDNVKEFENVDDMSYKELSKKAETLLPEGKVKSFITGLTHFDAGIFSKEVSSYTLSGQTIKGLDAGYDLGFCQTAFTVGRIEYAGRDGSLDKYTGYSGRVMFKPVKGQKMSVVYYGYTPSKKMLSEDQFFGDVDVSMPSFRTPVHIVSVSSAGSIVKNVSYEGEVAGSFRSKEQTKDTKPISDRMAYNIKLEGNIPKTPVTVEAGYEHAGKDFENNTAPVNMSGVDRYRLGTKGSFFKNFLTVGVEFNYLEQQSFSGKGGNTKWGFDIRTNSKRYPSVGISYKPFSTFRSYSDTLNVPQRPVIGEVLTAKASYQLKKKTYSIRLMSVYNKNRSTMDTVRTGSSIFQFSCVYLKGKLMLMPTLGSTSTITGDEEGVHQDTKFMTLAAAYKLTPKLTVSGGIDGGVSHFGLSKYGGNLGGSYEFRKVPITLRGNFRYNSYKILQDQPWKQLLGGMIDVTWRFRFKMEESLK